MKRRLKELAILAVVLGVIGAAVMVSGIIPVRASDRHWPITNWILSFSSSRSISTHSVGIKVPPLDEPGMLQLGAGIYESNCLWCHGAPGFPQPRVAAGMTPQPPNLQTAVSQWESRELFYIVQHGIKFAGMPAWPARLRSDEIWPVVTFLEKMPQMGPEVYEQLVDIQLAQDSQAPDIVARSCARCHGESGTSLDGERVPTLAGQKPGYLAMTLKAYANGSRHSGVMEPIAARLDEQQIQEVADWYAGQSLPADSDPSADTSRSSGQKDLTPSVDAGRQIAEQGLPANKIPSCSSCHGPGDKPRNANYPSLAGLPQHYLVQQLELLHERYRGGGENVELMHPVADALSPQQRWDVAAWYASQPAEPPQTGNQAD